EALVSGRVLRPHIQLGPELVLPHAEYVQQSAVPERLLADADLFPLVEIHRDSELAKRQVTLRTPRAAGLPITHRLGPENPFHIGDAGAFAALELFRPFEIAEPHQVLGGCRVDAV